MKSFNKSKIKERAKKRRQIKNEEKLKLLQKKIRRQLYANASDIKRLEKETRMKKVLKRKSRKNSKFQGLSKINYDLL